MIVDLISYYGFAVPALHCCSIQATGFPTNQFPIPKEAGHMPAWHRTHACGWAEKSCKDHEWVVGLYIRILEAIFYKTIKSLSSTFNINFQNNVIT